MNNEPVAWLLFRDNGESYPEYTTSYKQMREWETYLGDNERIEPHYTHPAKEHFEDEPQAEELHEILQSNTHPTKHDLGIAEAIGFDKGYQADMEKTLTPLTEDECEAIINKHDWFSKSWREMAKEIHDAILRKAQEK